MTENFAIPATSALRENHHLMSDATRTNTHPVEPDGLNNSNNAKKDDVQGVVPVPGSSKPWGEEFIKDVVNKTVNEVIRDSEYSHEATSMWVNQIVEIVVRSLVKVDRDNKYIGMCKPLCAFLMKRRSNRILTKTFVLANLACYATAIDAVTCMVVQNLKQGMRSATSCYWSSRTDSGYSLTYVGVFFDSGPWCHLYPYLTI